MPSNSIEFLNNQMQTTNLKETKEAYLNLCNLRLKI